MKVIPIGAPNTGKGTRIREILEQNGDQWESVCASTELKAEVKAGTAIGKEIKSYMDRGELVPDELIIRLVLEKVVQSKKNLFLDGFPRTVAQAKAMLNEGIRPDLIINLQVDEEIILERARNRIVCGKCGTSFSKEGDKAPKVEGICDCCGEQLKQRADDADEEIVRRRLEVYKAETEPVLSFFEETGIKICTMNNFGPEAAVKFKQLLLEN